MTNCALAVFLESLPEKDQAAIVADQLALPPATGTAERPRALGNSAAILSRSERATKGSSPLAPREDSMPLAVEQTERYD
jgi:hypothetical protein